MPAKIFPAANASIDEIWDYTERKWGGDQADKYVRGLIAAINELGKRRRHWKAPRGELSGAFFFRYQHHYIFCRELTKGRIGVVCILHENQDIPVRLKEDYEAGQEDN